MTSVGALVQADHPWGDPQLALLYDAFEFDADVPLYRDLAQAEGGDVLEVACGTGRLLVPLARAGNSIVGVDLSPHMLDLARSKLAAEPHLFERVEVVQADMRAFRVDRAFGLAIVAVKSFAYLTDRADQLRCLQQIARHLRPGGMLAIDLLHPQPDWVGAQPGSVRDDLLTRSVRHGFTLSRIESVVSTDLAGQVRVIRSAYEVVDDNGSVLTKRFVEWPFRYTYRFEAELLLEQAGFSVEAVYGGYEREPFRSESRSMIFVARHRP